MKHFFIEITYTVPAETIAHITPAHRHFLQGGYDQGLLLMSGPMNSKTGGVVIARAATLDDIQAFFSFDPYLANQAATYRFVEFDPLKRQPFLEDWVA
ncbi:MAG: hypothetical protein BGO78_10405 [Chloroflexi bacterium 44-23]|nr:MAG: hypothetical protein BGO78_10405 [Chloroflexi bacterium 44-23]